MSALGSSRQFSLELTQNRSFYGQVIFHTFATSDPCSGEPLSQEFATSYSKFRLSGAAGGSSGTACFTFHGYPVTLSTNDLASGPALAHRLLPTPLTPGPTHPSSENPLGHMAYPRHHQEESWTEHWPVGPRSHGGPGHQAPLRNVDPSASFCSAAKHLFP